MTSNIAMILDGSVLKMLTKLSLPNFLGVSSMPLVIIADVYFI